MKPVSFERACSIDDENHNARNFCWWMHFAVSFKVDGSERARTQSAAREQGMIARAHYVQRCIIQRRFKEGKAFILRLQLREQLKRSVSVAPALELRWYAR